MPSVELRLHRYCPASRGSNSRLRRPDPAFAYPLACPVSPDTSNPTMPAQPSPRACTHVVSARKWTYYRWAAHQPDQPAGAQGCGRHSLICDTPDRVRPLLRIAATAVGHLPRLVAAGPHALPSAHGLCVSVAVRQPIPTLAGALGAVRSLYPPRRPATWRAIHPPTPGGRYSSPAPPRLATNARRHHNFGFLTKSVFFIELCTFGPCCAKTTCFWVIAALFFQIGTSFRAKIPTGG